MKRLFEVIASIYVWLLIAFLTIIFSTLIIITSLFLRPFDPARSTANQLAVLWGKSIVWFNPFWKLKIQGKGYISKRQSYVLVANHMSLSDIICLFCIDRHFKWVARDSLFTIPFFGWAMSALGYIRLKRGQHGSIRDSFQKAQEWLVKDVPVLIFPEGTRSRSGELSPFKNGAFKLAILSGKPMVPIVIKGTGAALSKGKVGMSASVKGSVKIFPKIEVGAYSVEQHDELRDKVWVLMNDELKKD